ncbi:MAG: M23 family metallopeptidase [Rikenellaceae bacterium]
MKTEYNNHRPPWADKKNSFAQFLVRLLLNTGALCLLCAIFYVSFAYFVDTQVESKLRKSNDILKSEYQKLEQRYDTINTVLTNIEQRDINVFKTLFETEPYSTSKPKTELNYDQLLSKSNKELGFEFTDKLNLLKSKTSELKQLNESIIENTIALGEKTKKIPAIQPVINPDLSYLAASYGVRMHPFYRTLTFHSGIDFSMPENSRVFATADGTVESTSTKSSSSGNTITINHNNGYKTVYNHLGKINVKARQRVYRGDIIAWSGNSGLSFAPHLHYEILFEDKEVDPINYLFMELSYEQQLKIQTIAQSGMQSLD